MTEQEFMELNEEFKELFKKQAMMEESDLSRLCLIAYLFRDHIAESFVQEEYDGHPH